MSELWAMNGYGVYVWSAYAVAAAVLVGNAGLPLIAHWRIKRRIRRGEFADDAD